MTRIMITSLLPGTQYALQLRAEGNGAYSNWSPRLIFNTLSDTDLPIIPQNVTLVASGDSFHAEWDAVTTALSGRLSAVTRYELEWANGATTKTLTTPQKTDGTKVTFDLDFEANRALFGSPKGTVSLRVRAVDNKELRGGYSGTQTASNPVPGVPTGVTSTGSLNNITINWTPPADTDIIGYNIYIGAGKIAFVDGTTFSFNTTTYTAQTFTIKTVDKFNQESAGTNTTATATSPFGSDTTAPNVPTITSATLTTNAIASESALTVVWSLTSPPTDLQGFQIRYRKVGDTNWAQTSATDDDTTVVVPGLTPYVAYEVQVRSTDFSANYSAWSATTTATANTNSAPSTPAAPGVSSNTLQVQVTPTGKKADGVTNMESDVSYYEVYASTTTGFTPATANMLGVISTGPAMSEVFALPASGSGATQTWFVKVIAVDNGGLKSAASAQATANPNLIANANIADATITAAKITSLNANSIVAGTGIINDITVKSKLTLGDASTVGVIETFDYTNSSGATGASFSKNGIIIKTGAIEAAALKIQNGNNILPFSLATMSLPLSSTPIMLSSTTNATLTLDTISFNYYPQSFKVTQSAATGRQLILASTTTENNIVIPESGLTYIVSMWIRPTVTNSVTLGLYNGSTLIGEAVAKRVADDSTTLVANTWQRIYVTQAVSVVGANVRLTLPAVIANWNVDGVQVEVKTAGLNTPSPWKPPSTTIIDGSMIKTGAISSVNGAVLWNPTGGIGGAGAYVAPDVTLPVWSINMNGSAVFGDLLVRGRIVVGQVVDPPDALSTIASANYTPKNTGYMLRSDGYVEFNQVVTQTLDGSAIKTGTLEATTITSGTVNADLIISGSIKTAETGQRIEISPEGINWFDADDDPTLPSIELPTDPNKTARFTGNIAAQQLSVSNMISIQKIDTTRADAAPESARLEPGATMRLAIGVQAPSYAPSASVYWGAQNNTGVQPSNNNQAFSLGLHVDPSGNRFLMYRGGSYSSSTGWNGRILKTNSAGSALVLYNPAATANGAAIDRVFYQVVDMCDDEAGGYYLLWVAYDCDFGWVTHHDANLNEIPGAARYGATVMTGLAGPSGSQHFMPSGVYKSGGTLYIAGAHSDILSNSANRVIAMANYTISTGTNAYRKSTQTVTGTNFMRTDNSYATQYSGELRRGCWFDADGLHVPFCSSNGSLNMVMCFAVSGTTIVRSTATEFYLANLKQTLGLAWNGSQAFSNVNWDVTSGVYQLNWYSNINVNATSATWWAGHEWRRVSPAYATGIGATAAFTMYNKAYYSLSVGAIPFGTDATSADSLSLFIGGGTTRPANSVMWRVYTGTATSVAFTTTPGGPSNAGDARTNFPNGENASILSTASDAGGALIQLNSDGSGRMGPLKWTAANAYTGSNIPGPPTGVAGGHLDGSYPNPGITNKLFCSGVKTVTVVANTQFQVHVDYPQAMLAVPAVVASPVVTGSSNRWVSVSSVSASSGFNLNVFSTSGATFDVCWVAVCSP